MSATKPRAARLTVVGLAATVAVALTGVYAQTGAAGQAPRPEPAQSTTFPDYPKIDLAIGYKVDPQWPKKPAEAQWKAMSSMAVDASGNIWTLNRGNIPVEVYRPDGTLVRSWGQDGLVRNPHQVRFDREGNVWIADNGYHTVTKFTVDGKPLLTIGLKNDPGADDKRMNQPTDLAISPSGEIFVSDGYVNARVVHFDKTGRFVKAWGKLGVAPGEFSIPHGIAMDSKGRLYVVDRNNVRVQVFDQSGKFLDEWRNILTPWAIWITPNDEIYVCGSSPTRWSDLPPAGTQMNAVQARDQIVVRFDTTGRVKQLWSFPMGATGQPTKPGELNWVHGIAVAANGDLYLGDIRA
jgi:streptogramin lyase